MYEESDGSGVTLHELVRLNVDAKWQRNCLFREGQNGLLEILSEDVSEGSEPYPEGRGIALRPFFLPLFTQVRGTGILGSSPNTHSANFASPFG